MKKLKRQGNTDYVGKVKGKPQSTGSKLKTHMSSMCISGAQQHHPVEYVF